MNTDFIWNQTSRMCLMALIKISLNTIQNKLANKALKSQRIVNSIRKKLINGKYRAH